MQKKSKKLFKIIIAIILVALVFTVILEIPTIADWGDFETYDSSSSYDSWDSGSSSSSWSSSSSSRDDDYSWGSSSSSSSSGGLDLFDIWFLLKFLFASPFSIMFTLIVILFIALIVKKYKGVANDITQITQKVVPTMRTVVDEALKQRVFGFDDTPIEDEIQAEDPMFNKAEFLSWASDMFIKLQYAWSDRNLEEIRYFVTPELYEKTNNQVQRYITNKQINKLERISVNISKIKSFEHQGDRDVLKVILDTKMIDYIVDENTGKVIRGDQNTNIMNPYILTFTRKTGIKTPEGGAKAVTMNCPNCGGATKILSAGKCPYCGSIITTRDNNWTLSEMARYTPNS